MKGKPNFRQLSRGRRRAVAPASAGDLVTLEPLLAEGELPLLARPKVAGVDLLGWVDSQRELISERLLKHGGILFRGFDFNGAENLERLVSVVSGNALEYRERSSPRSQVGGKVYTSTEYPAHQEIFLHNENSYQHQWPMKVFFHCVIAAESGGETPIADCRRVLAALDPALVERFAQRGVLYQRNFTEALGLPWQNVFQTEDRAEVEAYCERAGIELEWRDDGGLRTLARRQALAEHPVTGERLWFNHATFFHITTLPLEIREGLLAQFSLRDLPSNSMYGDGEPIEDEVLDQLRAAYRAATVTFPWQVGDVLLLDNMLVAHGRAPFTGQRRVLVGMAEPQAAPQAVSPAH